MMVLTWENFVISLQHSPGCIYIGPLYNFAFLSAVSCQNEPSDVAPIGLFLLRGALGISRWVCSYRAL